jgi:proteasome assembly chaperone (PAC2) family protein
MKSGIWKNMAPLARARRIRLGEVEMGQGLSGLLAALTTSEPLVGRARSIVARSFGYFCDPKVAMNKIETDLSLGTLGLET